jgi:hypothetical protein
VMMTSVIIMLVVATFGEEDVCDDDVNDDVVDDDVGNNDIH